MDTSEQAVPKVEMAVNRSHIKKRGEKLKQKAMAFGMVS